MNYSAKGTITPTRDASVSCGNEITSFGILGSQDELPNPAELLLGAFAACCLKNVQRFSELLGFHYAGATIEVTGERQASPTKMIVIRYVIRVSGADAKLNPELLHKNLRKFGTIYNTLKEVCDVSGELLTG